jgi:hypothetical protein
MSKRYADIRHLLCALGFDPKPYGIEITLRTGSEIPHANCLVIDVWRGSREGETPLVRIEHFRESPDTSEYPWKHTVINREPLAIERAIKLAIAFARRQQIPVVLVGRQALGPAPVFKLNAPRSGA